MAHSPRPTLPPLHSLHLPTPTRVHESYDLDDLTRRNGHPDLTNSRQSQPSVSPPVPCLSPCTNTPASRQKTPFPPRKVRLVPTSFENADAVVLVPPPSAPSAPPPKPLLLVGPALARLRHPRRQLVKGARIHPYRIARSADRRPPTGPDHAKACQPTS